MFVTPPSSRPEDRASEGKRKRRESNQADKDTVDGTELSASPDLKKGKHSNMKRTPQLNMAQSRLTGTGGTLKIQQTTLSPASGPPSSLPDVPAGDSAGSTGGCGGAPPSQPVAVLAGSGVEPLTADFFRGLIGENTRQITQRIDAMAGDVAGLSRSVNENKSRISKITEKMGEHDGAMEAHKSQMKNLEARISRLEERAPSSVGSGADRSESYLWARRSVRFWPIDRSSDDSLWQGAGEFIHSALGIPDSDICQEDIEMVTPAPSPRLPSGNLNNEAIVTFFCPRKRDSVMAKVGALSTFVDGQGKPTAGVRLEIPPQLQDTFRLLSRFGARLRARHGEGTKRHIRFDDMEGTLIASVKLPGDANWSRVTPDMARKDLEETTKEESANIMKRISAVKADSQILGPRQRLAVPMEGIGRAAAGTGQCEPAPAAAQRPWRPRPGQHS